MKTRVYAFLQDLGKSFMFPIATLSAMGILVGIGSAFTAPNDGKIFVFAKSYC